MASHYLDRVANARGLAGIATTTDIVFGLPAQDILAEAQSQAVDLTKVVRTPLCSVCDTALHD